MSLKVKVKSGDSLWELAEEYLKNGNRYKEIMTASGITSTTIYPGQTLTIPTPEPTPTTTTQDYFTYEVKSGDTFWGLGIRFDIPYQIIMSRNGYSDAYHLSVGAKLQIPFAKKTPIIVKERAPFRFIVNKGFAISGDFTDTHLGLDVAHNSESGGPNNTKICAPFTGVVDRATSSGSAGNYVRIRFDDYEMKVTWYTYLKHLASFFVKVGDRVTIGMIIAIMGRTGGDWGVHCHWDLVKCPLGMEYNNSDEVMRRKYSVHPLLWSAAYPDQTVGEVTAENYKKLIKYYKAA